MKPETLRTIVRVTAVILIGLGLSHAVNYEFGIGAALLLTQVKL
jgi:hypothetical protein